jgi:hypothetical protein
MGKFVDFCEFFFRGGLYAKNQIYASRSDFHLTGNLPLNAPDARQLPSSFTFYQLEEEKLEISRIS